MAVSIIYDTIAKYNGHIYGTIVKILNCYIRIEINCSMRGVKRGGKKKKKMIHKGISTRKWKKKKQVLHGILGGGHSKECVDCDLVKVAKLAHHILFSSGIDSIFHMFFGSNTY